MFDNLVKRKEEYFTEFKVLYDEIDLKKNKSGLVLTTAVSIFNL